MVGEMVLDGRRDVLSHILISLSSWLSEFMPSSEICSKQCFTA